ncbi:MAG: hypothetical protein ABW123_00530 [Cystobacter sp.]
MHHPRPHELQQLLVEARRLELGSPQQVKVLGELRKHCPTFVPALLLASRAELWSPDDTISAQAAFDEVERMLQVAVDVSERTPGALNEQARFYSVVRDSSAAAEALYREASERALQSLEESWAGLLEALGEQNKTEEAARLAERARQLFPHSPLLAEARRFSGLGE